MQEIKRFFFSSAQKRLAAYGFIGWTPISTWQISGRNISLPALPVSKDACEPDIIAVPGARPSQQA
jgi:hypothetical protein